VSLAVNNREHYTALRGGASNDKQDRERVHFTLSGENAKIEEIITFMKSGKELNSWGAKVRNSFLLNLVIDM